MRIVDLEALRGELAENARIQATGAVKAAGVAPELALAGPAGTNLVEFQPGARTHWHTHAGGQILVVVAGECEAAAEDGNTLTAPAGSVVLAEPGERHWHGASARGPMAHFAITLGATEWQEPVE